MKPALIKKLKKVKCLALDIDGILTDARVFWIEGQGWTRSFNIRDGYGIKLLNRMNLPIALLTGGDAPDIFARAKALEVEHIYAGNENKLESYEALKKKLKLQDEEIAYMGDEVFDLPVLERVGFSATVPDAIPEVIQSVDYVTKRLGGNGAVREVIDWLIRARG